MFATSCVDQFVVRNKCEQIIFVVDRTRLYVEHVMMSEHIDLGVMFRSIDVCQSSDNRNKQRHDLSNS